MKDRIDTQNLQDINHLKSLIKQDFTLLNDTPESCQAIRRSVDNCCQMCINTEGKQSEHLL